MHWYCFLLSFPHTIHLRNGYVWFSVHCNSQNRPYKLGLEMRPFHSLIEKRIVLTTVLFCIVNVHCPAKVYLFSTGLILTFIIKSVSIACSSHQDRQTYGTIIALVVRANIIWHRPFIRCLSLLLLKLLQFSPLSLQHKTDVCSKEQCFCFVSPSF